MAHQDGTVGPDGKGPLKASFLLGKLASLNCKIPGSSLISGMRFELVLLLPCVLVFDKIPAYSSHYGGTKRPAYFFNGLF